MRHRLNILTLICCSLLCTMFGINGVWAVDIEDSYMNGSSGNIAGCSGKNCYSGEVGFRISIVDKNGDRCKFDSKTGTLCGTTGKTIKSQDFWFGNPAQDVNEFYNSAQCYTFKDEKIKWEFSDWIKDKKIGDLVNVDETSIWNPTVSSKSNESGAYIVNCNQKTPQSMYSLFGDLYTPTNWEKSDPLIEATRNPKNMEKIIDWFNTEQNNGNEKVLNKVLEKLISKQVSEISNGIEKANIQFEQLLMVTNYDNGDTDSYVSFMGSVAETSYLYLHMPTPKAYISTGASRACTIQNSFTVYGYKAGSDINHTGCGSSMFAGGYWTGWWGDFSDKHLSKAKEAVPTRNIKKYLNGNLTKDNLDLSYFYKTKDTSNVFNVKISDKFGNNCNKNARKIVEMYCPNGNCNNKYIEALSNDDDTKKCIKNGQIDSKCNALEPNNIKLYKGIKDGLSDACSEIACDTLASDVFNKYKSASNQIGKENSDYEKYVGWLAEIYNDNMLVTVFWRDILEKSSPSCSNETYECPPDSSGSISNCNASTTFADNMDVKCWQKNIAYNNINNTSDYSAYETSKDIKFSSEKLNGCKVYCNESVSFSLPNENGSYGTKAGRIFKWGIDDDRANSKFGSMTVKKTCQIVKNAEGGICTSNTFNPVYWTQTTDKSDSTKYGIGTTITLNYREPVSGKEISSQKLNTSLNSVILTTATDGNKEIDPNKVSNYNYNCGGKCNQKFTNKSFTVTATYDFDYSSDFHWYSDKGDSFKITPESSINAEEKSQYVELGYGLPTGFTSPNVSYSTYKDNQGYTWLSTAKKTEGYMYATIKNIGTKKSDGSYHFDKLIKTKSKDNSEGFNTDGSLTYGCDYSIKNEIIGTECVGSDGDPNYCNPKTSPKGLDVVFRTVELMNKNTTDELNKAFPGMSGNGRERGANWAKLTQKEIFDVLGSSVYNKDKPMYEITLNVPIIQKIRKWNKTARSKNIDPYTDMTRLTDEQNKVDNDDSYGHTGYIYRDHVVDGKVDGTNVMSRFLGQLFREGNLKTECFKPSGSVTTHEYKCQQ